MKFEYNLIWNNEILDTASTIKEAVFLKIEYQLAFSSPVTIKKERVK